MVDETEIPDNAEAVEQQEEQPLTLKAINNLSHISKQHLAVYRDHQKFAVCVNSLMVEFGYAQLPEGMNLPEAEIALSVLKSLCNEEIKADGATHEAIQNSIALLEQELAR